MQAARKRVFRAMKKPEVINNFREFMYNSN
jgi:hypothetical protein